MKWLKNNIVTLVLIGIIIWGVFALINAGGVTSKYKDEIKALNDSIADYEVRIQRSYDSARVYKSLADQAYFESLSYQDSLTTKRIELIKTNIDYAKALVKLNVAPTDSLYWDVTRRLDSLSLQW